MNNVIQKGVAPEIFKEFKKPIDYDALGLGHLNSKYTYDNIS